MSALKLSQKDPELQRRKQARHAGSEALVPKINAMNISLSRQDGIACCITVAMCALEKNQTN